MFQRAHQKQRTLDVGHAKRAEAARSTVGKRTLTEDQTFDPPNLYARAIESARRELRAVRTALPTYAKTLRRTDLEPLARQAQLTQSALQIRHLLMTANQHVKALEKAASYRDPIVVFLRHEVDTLAARAGKLGVYRGAEDMLPRGHVEETRSPAEGAQRVRKPSAAQQRRQAVAKMSTPEPARKFASAGARTPVTASSPSSAPRGVQRTAGQ